MTREFVFFGQIGGRMCVRTAGETIFLPAGATLVDTMRRFCANRAEPLAAKWVEVYLLDEMDARLVERTLAAEAELGGIPLATDLQAIADAPTEAERERLTREYEAVTELAIRTAEAGGEDAHDPGRAAELLTTHAGDWALAEAQRRWAGIPDPEPVFHGHTTRAVEFPGTGCRILYDDVQRLFMPQVYPTTRALRPNFDEWAMEHSAGYRWADCWEV